MEVLLAGDAGAEGGGLRAVVAAGAGDLEEAAPVVVVEAAVATGQDDEVGEEALRLLVGVGLDELEQWS